MRWWRYGDILEYWLLSLMIFEVPTVNNNGLVSNQYFSGILNSSNSTRRFQCLWITDGFWFFGPNTSCNNSPAGIIGRITVVQIPVWGSVQRFLIHHLISLNLTGFMMPASPDFFVKWPSWSGIPAFWQRAVNLGFRKHPHSGSLTSSTGFKIGIRFASCGLAGWKAFA